MSRTPRTALSGKSAKSARNLREMKKVTVIVPVYNVVDYLPQCVESIVRQTYAHLEVILVDDGSTDGSAPLCDEYAARDPRIRVIHKANGGLSDARNAALDAMTGDIVMMVDGDDWLQTDAIEQLLHLMENTGADVAVGGWRIVQDDAVPNYERRTPPGSVHEYGAHQALRNIFYQSGMNHSACGRLFKAHLFKSLRFPRGLLYEDLAVAYDLYRQCSKVTFADSRFYNYRQRPQSITNTFNAKRVDVLNILESLEQRLAHEGSQHQPAVRSRLLSAYFNILLLCPSTDDFQPVVDRCWKGIKRLRWCCLTDVHVRLKNKLGILASLAGETAFLALFKGKILKKY